MSVYANVAELIMIKKEINEITKYIFLKSNPQKADLAFVFGTRYQEATSKAYELYRDKLVPLMLVCGGINRITGENEALAMSKKLINLGVKQKDLLLEKKSTNTLENVVFSKQLLDKKVGLNDIKKIIAVVKNYHSRRALMTLKKYFPNNIEIIPVTYDVFGFTETNWFESEIGTEKVSGEMDRIQKYLKKGDIQEL